LGKKMVQTVKRLSLTLAAACIMVAAVPGPLPAQFRNHVKLESARIHFKKGLIHYNRLQYLAAVEHFRRAVSVYPEYITARDYLSRSYRMAGFLKSAMRELEMLKELSPDNPAVVSRYEALQFRYSLRPGGFPYDNLVHVGRYDSYNMKRFSFDVPMGMTVDKEKNLYITSFQTGKLVSLDVNGRGIDAGTPQLNGRLYGIDRYENTFAVTDFAHDQVIFLNSRGRVTGTAGKPGNGPGAFHGPEGVAFDDEGNLYVVDSGNHRVQKLNRKGEYILSFGHKGRSRNAFMKPSDVAVRGSIIYITDTGNRRIVVADTYGNVTDILRPEGLTSPRGITVKDKLLIVADQAKGILFYDTETKKGSWFKSWEDGKESFLSPVAVEISDDNFIYCADNRRSRIDVFTHAQNRYTNLDMEITSTDVSQYPVVALYMNIRNRTGDPVYGLKKENFFITEDSARISNFRINYLKQKASSVSTVFCVDRSKAAENYHREISWAADFYLRKMTTSDSVRVLNFNNKYWQGNPFDWSRRRTQRALKKMNYGYGKALGRTLYNGITDLLPRLNRRALILFTDGTLQSDSFQQYTPDVIIRYARAHYIPVHIISFKKPDPILVEIAEKTEGSVIQSGKMDSIKGLYKKIKDSRECRYVMVYSTYKSPAFRGFWSDVHLKVNFRGLKGSEWGGYFVPARNK